MILFPNAKINLGLYITEKRSDGFHNLSTCFYPVPWSDILEITPHDTFEFSTSGLAISGALETNLCYRAFMLLKEAFNIAPVHIHLHKVIPMGAGLGGGSSDAASTLIGLNTLWDLHLDIATLCQLGLKLGADVPFFIFGQNAFVEGIGEKLKAISLKTQDFVVIFPNQGIATAHIFQDPDLTRDHAPITIDGFLASPSSYQSNDCQAVAVQKCPEVKEALDWIFKAVPYSAPCMSGSGSSVFAALDPKTDTANLENLLQNLPKGWIGRIVRGLNKNPAYNLISSD